MLNRIFIAFAAALCLFSSACSAHKCFFRVTEPLAPEEIQRQKSLYKNIHPYEPNEYVFYKPVNKLQQDYNYLHSSENRLLEYIEGSLYVTGNMKFDAFAVNAKADGSFTLPMTLELDYKLFRDDDGKVNRDIVFTYDAKSKKFYNGTEEIYDVYDKQLYKSIYNTLTRHDIPDNEYYEERRPYSIVEYNGRHLLAAQEKKRHAIKAHELDGDALFFEDIDFKEHCDIFNSRLHNVICVTRSALYNRYYHRYHPRETTATQIYIVDYIYYKDENGVWKESLADRNFKPRYSSNSEDAAPDQKKCDELAKQLGIDGKGWRK